MQAIRVLVTIEKQMTDRLVNAISVARQQLVPYDMCRCPDLSQVNFVKILCTTHYTELSLIKLEHEEEIDSLASCNI